MRNFLKRYITLIILTILVVIAGYFIFQKLNSKEIPKNLVEGSGRIDGDLILLNTKYPARIDKIFVNEGNKISLNQKIATLKSDEFLSKKNASKEAVQILINQKNAFIQTIKAQKIQLELLKSTLPKIVKIKKQNLNSLDNALKNINIKIDVLTLKYKKIKKDFLRYKKLYKQKAIDSDKMELARLKYNSTRKELYSLKIDEKSTKNSIKIAQNSMEIAKENLLQIDIAKHKLLASNAKLNSMSNQIQQAKALENEIKAMINELTLKSPINGYVIEKIGYKGEVIGSGMGVVSVSDTSSYYLKLFVDTIENGKIKIGDKAVIFLDSYPNKPFKAIVTRIAQKAEFTPKEVSVKSDRIQRVYAVRLKPLKYDARLKLGIPAIGIISINNKDLPNSLNEIPKI